MKQHTTAERLKQLMKVSGLKQANIVRAVELYCNKYNVKLVKRILSQYVSGKTEPGYEKLMLFGLAFNISAV